MHEMWKREQVHANARKMYRAEILGKEFGIMGNATHGRTRYGKKNGQAERSFDLVQIVLGLRTTENGTTTDELLQAGASGHKRAWQRVQTFFRFLKMAGSLPRRQRIGRLKDKKDGLQGKKKGDCGMSSKREDSWHKKVCRTSPERRCCRTGKRVQGHA